MNQRTYIKRCILYKSTEPYLCNQSELAIFASLRTSRILIKTMETTGNLLSEFLILTLSKLFRFSYESISILIISFLTPV